LIEHDWMKTNWHDGLSMENANDRDLPYVTTTERRRREEHNAKLQAAISGENAALDERALALTKKHEAARLAQIPESLRGMSRRCSRRLPISDRPCRRILQKSSKRTCGSTAPARQN